MLRALSVGAWMFLCVGCGARNALEVESDGEPSRRCEELDITGVPECTRRNPEALPLARIGPDPGGAPGEEDGDGFSLASDGESLYFASEGRIFRVAMTGGAPEPLTPPHSAGRGVKLFDGHVYWQHQEVVMRVLARGGEVEPVVELSSGSRWALAPDAILSWAAHATGEPLYRTSISTGETSELWSGDPEEDIRHVRADDEHLYIAMRHDLLRMPLDGGPVEQLVEGGAEIDYVNPLRVLGDDLLVTEEQVYFGAYSSVSPDLSSYAIYRLSKATGSKPEAIVPGIPKRMVAHGGALFADILVVAFVDEPGAQSEIVRVPLDGGAVERIADSDARSLLQEKGVVYDAAGLAVSDCWVYFNLHCEDEPKAFRLVALPWGAHATGP